MKLNKETLKRIIKEELDAALEEADSMSPFQRKVADQKAKSDAVQTYSDHRSEIDPLKDQYQTDLNYSDSAYLDDIMAVAPQLSREQAIAIANLFSSEMEMVDKEPGM